jgi:hypothetical protein
MGGMVSRLFCNWFSEIFSPQGEHLGLGLVWMIGENALARDREGRAIPCKDDVALCQIVGLSRIAQAEQKTFSQKWERLGRELSSTSRIVAQFSSFKDAPVHRVRAANRSILPNY